MSIVIKGSEPFDVMVASNIVNCQTANIKFKNISFRCETIEDADGTVFVKMPPAQPEWITVTERLPEDDTEVIVSCTDDSGDHEFSYTTIGWHFKGVWVVGNERSYFVRAWMPLPKSYSERK